MLDGDAIVQHAKGVADYHALRRELARKRSGKLTYYGFDLLYLDGKDLRQDTLLTPKQKLKAPIADTSAVPLCRSHRSSAILRTGRSN